MRGRVGITSLEIKSYAMGYHVYTRVDWQGVGVYAKT